MKFLTTKQVAEELKITGRRVRALAADRKVGQQLPDGTWLFTPKDVEKLRVRVSGRPAR